MPTFRKKPACQCLVEWLPVFEAELKRRGLIKSSIDIYQLIGGASASAGTHRPGGAFDIKQTGAMVEWVARNMGAAFWTRETSQGFEIRHGHGVLNGCPHNRGGRYQIGALRLGRNGLGRGGLAGKDDGNGPRKLCTWREGIAWAKAQKPVKARTTSVRVYEKNTASDRGTWTRRARILNARLRAVRPHFMAAVELYPRRRPYLSGLLRGFMSMTTNYNGKVQYLLDSTAGWEKVGKGQKVALGNGKHAAGQHYRHRTSGAHLVLVVPHFSWEHSAWRKRQAEATNLGEWIKTTFPNLPVIVTGDFNDAHKDTATRPDDTAGDVLEGFGLHDLYYDVPGPKKRGEQYNTANQGKTPPPKSGIHIDRFFGTGQIKGTSWTCDVTEPADRDHWGVYMDATITHDV